MSKSGRCIAEPATGAGLVSTYTIDDFSVGSHFYRCDVCVSAVHSTRELKYAYVA